MPLRRWFVAGLAVLAVAVFVTLTWMMVARQRVASVGVFRYDGRDWKRMPQPAGVPERIFVSAKGTLWIQTTSPVAFIRFEGDQWTNQFTAADSNVRAVALDGEEIWAAASDAVIRFDGETWRRYRELPGAVAIVAYSRQAVALDANGNLSTFNGSGWSTRKLALPGLNWGSSDAPSMAFAGGATWLACQGLWRYDGTWRRVLGPEIEPALIGSTPGQVWVRTKDGGIALRWDGQNVDQRPYPPGPVKSVPYQVISSRRQVWIASTQGIWRSTGDSWARIVLPRGTGPEARHLAVAGDDSLWALLPAPAAENWVVPVAVNLAALLFIALAVWIRTRGPRHSPVDTQPGPAPKPEPEPESRELSWLDGFLTLLLIATPFVRSLSPDLPRWLLPAAALAGGIVLAVRRSLRKRTPNPWDPIGPGGPSRYLWRETLPDLAIAVGFAVFLGADWIKEEFGIVLPGYVWLLLLAAAWWRHRQQQPSQQRPS